LKEKCISSPKTKKNDDGRVVGEAVTQLEKWICAFNHVVTAFSQSIIELADEQIRHLPTPDPTEGPIVSENLWKRLTPNSISSPKTKQNDDGRVFGEAVM
jgi:hypothetical protein